LNNGKAIHQELHMSEFDSSGKELQVGSDISLPPKDIANKYIEGEFYSKPRGRCLRSLNTASTAYFTSSPFPMFHRPTFQKRADSMYTLQPPLEKCFRASWSMILAFGSHYAADSCPNVPLQDTEGWKYFTAAHDKLPDLLQGSNLSALQALLLIVSIDRRYWFYQSFEIAVFANSDNNVGSISPVYQPGIQVDAYGRMCSDGAGSWLTSRLSRNEFATHCPRGKDKGLLGMLCNGQDHFDVRRPFFCTTRL
jgi:hypothetical protein